jgi:hypothetical protein
VGLAGLAAEDQEAAGKDLRPGDRNKPRESEPSSGFRNHLVQSPHFNDRDMKSQHFLNVFQFKWFS